jgi:hypothetical protein
MIWALDISKTKTALVTGRADEIPRATSIVGKDVDVYAAAKQLQGVLNDRFALQSERPDFIVYEAPLGSGIYSKRKSDGEGGEQAISGAHTAMALMGMTVAVTLFADWVGVPRKAVSVNSVRKTFVGQPRFKDKNEGKRHAKAMCQLLGWPVKNLDEADGMAVWHYGTTLFARKHAVPILPTMHAKIALQLGAGKGALFERVA